MKRSGSHSERRGDRVIAGADVKGPRPRTRQQTCFVFSGVRARTFRRPGDGPRIRVVREFLEIGSL